MKNRVTEENPNGAGPGIWPRFLYDAHLLPDVCKALRAGNYEKHSIAFCGIASTTWSRWTKLGREAAEAMNDEDIPPFYSSDKSTDPIHDFWVVNNEGVKALWAQNRQIVYACLWATVQKAQADRTVGLVTRIKKASEKNWTAAAWILERTQPDDFARTERVALGGVDPDRPMRFEIGIQGGISPADVPPDVLPEQPDEQSAGK